MVMFDLPTSWPRLGNALLLCSDQVALADTSSLEQLNDQNDHRDNKQDVDKTAECVAADESEQPQN
jgi:hypothetical protein